MVFANSSVSLPVLPPLFACCSKAGLPLLTQGAAGCCSPLVLPHGAHSSQDGLVEVLCVALQLF